MVQMNFIKVLSKTILPQSWIDKNGLTVNAEKSCYLAYGKIIASIDLLGPNFCCRDTANYLGLVIDKRFTFKEPIVLVNKKLSKFC